VDVPPSGPTQLIKALYKRRDPRLRIRVIFREARQYTDAPYALTLLRTRRKRPSDCRSTKKCNELPPLHFDPPCN
jgi:hypothetical protein